MKTTWSISRKTAYPELSSDISTEVLIIGGGLAGMCLAYQLKRSEIKVVLIDKGRIGEGATELTTAITTADIDTNAADMIKMFGQNKARQIWHSGEKAIDEIERIQSSEKINCEFMRTPLYIYASSKKELKWLAKEDPAIKWLGGSCLFYSGPAAGLRIDGYIKLENQAKFHPLKFLIGLAGKVTERGGLIFETTEAHEIRKEGNLFKVLTKFGTISAKKVVITTYQPFKNPKQVFLKKGMYVSYMMELETEPGIMDEASYIDLENPYHYFRIDRGAKYDRVLLGGEDHRKEIKISRAKCFKELENHWRKIFPGGYKVVNKWSGPILESIDGVAFIGEVSKNLFLATAFSGNGMTYSMIAGMLIKDLILGNKNPWKKLYDPKRIPTLKQVFYKTNDYLGELFGGAVKHILKR